MAEQRVQRRLAAILAADVVGYSRLMESGEEGTLARMKKLRNDVIDPSGLCHEASTQPVTQPSYGTRLMAYRAVDAYVYDRVRHFLVKRHKVPTRGTRRYTHAVVHGELGVLHLRRVHLGLPP